MPDDERRAIVDREHLRVLSICYYVTAGFNAFFSLFGLMYVFMGLAFRTLPMAEGSNQPPPEVGPLFSLFGFVWFALTIFAAYLCFLAARRLHEHRSRTFCLVVAGLTCLAVPYGAALGAFTFLVLGRDSVVRMFREPTSHA